jgi:hypothetical protein
MLTSELFNQCTLSSGTLRQQVPARNRWFGEASCKDAAGAIHCLTCDPTASAVLLHCPSLAMTSCLYS